MLPTLPLLTVLALVTLALEVLFVARRSPRQLPFLVWLAVLSIQAGYAAWNPGAHAGHLARALDLAATAGLPLVITAWLPFSDGVRRLSVAIAVLAFLVGLKFDGDLVPLAARVAIDGVLVVFLTRSAFDALDELRDVDEKQGYFAALALGLGGLVSAVWRVVAHDRGVVSAVASIVASVVGIAVYIPTVFAHAFRHDTPEFLERQAISSRRMGLYASKDRLDRARAALAAIPKGEVPVLGDFPHAGPLAKRAGRDSELLRIAATDFEIAAIIEVLSALLGGFDDLRETRRHLGRVREILTELEEHVGKTAPIDVVTVATTCASFKRETVMQPMLFSAIAVMRTSAVERGIDAVDECLLITE